MVRLVPVAQKMLEYMTDKKDANWQVHFNMLVENSSFPELNEIDPVVPKIQLACAELADVASGFKRKTVQTRFFETGDNYYLGKSCLNPVIQLLIWLPLAHLHFPFSFVPCRHGISS